MHGAHHNVHFYVTCWLNPRPTITHDGPPQCPPLHTIHNWWCYTTRPAHIIIDLIYPVWCKRLKFNHVTYRSPATTINVLEMWIKNIEKAIILSEPWLSGDHLWKPQRLTWYGRRYSGVYAEMVTIENLNTSINPTNKPITILNYKTCVCVLSLIYP